MAHSLSDAWLGKPLNQYFYMKLNLSSQIVLNKVPEQYYRPRTAVERSEITR